ncbi:C39 family peptidase [Undibacterium sp. TS12]|uniref:C39 family peptidase n=1 Tax=Undibacterium sp. TS12 TaxID=2908202 RepID=UPI001F4CC097|nr:C39 family peptidase [Undibacterium sp. TS12]MCH8620786.1 C39 family peptidase [Undibacterium sp. TS12]
MKSRLKHLVLGISFFLMLPFALAQSRQLNVPLTIQEHSQWCWSASSKAVLNYYSRTPSQCQIVNWAFGLNYACGNSNFNWNSYANQPNSLYGGGGSVQSILQHWSVPNSAYASALSWNTVVSDINANRPFIIRYGWTNGGGHIMVGSGYETYNGVNYIYIMNPWPGEGNTYRTYSSAVYASDHSWTHSERMNINP